MIYIVKPFLRRVGEVHSTRDNLPRGVVAIFFIVLILSAVTTEAVGIHALFGSFMAGIVMPDNKKFKRILIEKVEDIALVLLLPLFFVYTGLRTQIGLINDLYLWKICGMVILVAITGKFAGSAMAAKITGQTWRDSLTIGALMNTRGLVELVALNIGYDLGVLSPEIFAMLVIMALVTTFMTAPALDLTERLFRKRGAEASGRIYNILISFGNPLMGVALLRVARHFTGKLNGKTRITIMHLFPGNLFNTYKIDDYEKRNFTPVKAEAKKLELDPEFIFKVSEDIDNDITGEANSGKYDLLLIGLGQSIYEGTMLGRLLGFSRIILKPGKIFKRSGQTADSLFLSPFDKRTSDIMNRSKIPVGVLVNKNLYKIDNVLVAAMGIGDKYLNIYAEQLSKNSVVDVKVFSQGGALPSAKTSGTATEAPEGSKTSHEFPAGYDLMIASPEGIGKLPQVYSFRKEDLPSMLIIRK